jgi:hypothetical protein
VDLISEALLMQMARLKIQIFEAKTLTRKLDRAVEMLVEVE